MAQTPQGMWSAPSRICVAIFKCRAGARANLLFERNGSSFRYSIHPSTLRPDYRVSFVTLILKLGTKSLR